MSLRRQCHLTTLAITLFLGLPGFALSALSYARLEATAQERFGLAGTAVVAEWTRLIELGGPQPPLEQLRRVNDFVNSRVHFESDASVWGQDDYWATPLETLSRGRGDCEDFAIAKYVSLLALGMPVSKLRLIYVKARVDNGGQASFQAHMVLGYYEDVAGEPQLLDNLVPDIQNASARTDLVPIFSFNGEGLWAGGTLSGSDPSARLSRWRDLLERLKDEGFL